MTCKNFPKERNPRNTQQRQELGWSCGTHPQSQETRSFSVFILHVQFSHLRHNLGESAIGDKNFVWEVKLMSDIIHVSKSCGRTEFLGETLCICPPPTATACPWILTHRSSRTFPPMLPVYLKNCSKNCSTSSFKKDSATGTQSCACPSKMKASSLQKFMSQLPRPCSLLWGALKKPGFNCAMCYQNSRKQISTMGHECAQFCAILNKN